MTATAEGTAATAGLVDDPLVRVTDLTKRFPVGADTVHAVEKVSLCDRPGGDTGRGRGERLRQVDAGQPDRSVARTDERPHRTRRRRHHRARHPGVETPPPQDAGRLPGPVRQPRSAAAGGKGGGRTAADPRGGQAGCCARRDGPQPVRGRRTRSRPTSTSSPISSPAGSVSASASPGRWHWSRSWWWPTRRSRRSTCRSRPRSSIS